jgi:hypothetical protein
VCVCLWIDRVSKGVIFLSFCGAHLAFFLSLSLALLGTLEAMFLWAHIATFRHVSSPCQQSTCACDLYLLYKDLKIDRAVIGALTLGPPNYVRY